jgi:MFS superfamily sulfate permease-like transporter
MAEHSDGQSTAAWTAVAILLLAAFLICLAVVIASWPMAIVGLVLVVVGVAAGKIMAMVGLGQAEPEHSPTGTEAR